MRLFYAKSVSILMTVFGTFAVAGLAFAQVSDSAKNLYMVQKPFESHGDVQLGYGYGFLNPYQDLHEVLLKANYRFHPNFQAGIEGVYFSPIKNEATKALESSLGGVSIKTEFQDPRYSIHATVGAIPLSGLLNFFSYKVMPFDLVLGAKGGITQYKKSGSAPSFGPTLEYKIYFLDRLGFYFGLEYAFERIPGISGGPAVWVSQSHVAGGLTWAF